MSETGFKCPKCGQTAEFTAYAVVLYGPCCITADGWDYWSEPSHVELHKHALMACPECGYETHHSEFEEEV